MRFHVGSLNEYAQTTIDVSLFSIINVPCFYLRTKAKRVNGQRGEDLIIPVPLGTVVRDEKTGHVMADMKELGQQVTVVSGGRGGSPVTSAGGGEKGNRRMIILEYKMYTDVGLVG